MSEMPLQSLEHVNNSPVEALSDKTTRIMVWIKDYAGPNFHQWKPIWNGRSAGAKAARAEMRAQQPQSKKMKRKLAAAALEDHSLLLRALALPMPQALV